MGVFYHHIINYLHMKKDTLNIRETILNQQNKKSDKIVEIILVVYFILGIVLS